MVIDQGIGIENACQRFDLERSGWCNIRNADAETRGEFSTPAQWRFNPFANAYFFNEILGN
jgi:hypothetical protein